MAQAFNLLEKVKAEGAVSFTSDCWTSPFAISFLLLVAFGYFDGKRIRIPLAIRVMSEDHTGHWAICDLRSQLEWKKFKQ